MRRDATCTCNMKKCKKGQKIYDNKAKESGECEVQILHICMLCAALDYREGWGERVRVRERERGSCCGTLLHKLYVTI